MSELFIAEVWLRIGETWEGDPNPNVATSLLHRSRHETQQAAETAAAQELAEIRAHAYYRTAGYLPEHFFSSVSEAVRPEVKA
jgi:hypothetical protein